ncbi:MAG TPA: tripartite tricarboxylate transporter substrate binding protein [Burkholderiaceae bacterium]|nr:tripartite tricarboxylate transporter substrate binding protein [Burkholderiaceae bacterium]
MSSPRIRRTLLAACVAVAAATVAPTAAAWTDRPVRMVVPAPPGGTMDVVARVLAEQLAAELGQPVVVDNKPGGGGVIGIQALLQAPADGTTVMVTASNVLTEIPHVVKTPYDAMKDVRPIAAIARSTMVMVGAPSFAPADLKAVVEHAKANRGTVSFASYSAGTASQYAGMILAQKAGIELTHVPFQGSPPGLQQVMGGHIPLMFDGIVTSLPLVNGNKIKAYAIASKTRSPYLPNVPTFAELGYPDMDFSNWIGVVASAQVPPALAARINAAVLKAAAAPKLRDRLTAAGFEVGLTQSSDALAQAVRAESERNAAIVRTFDIKL